MFFGNMFPRLLNLLMLLLNANCNNGVSGESNIIISYFERIILVLF